MDLALGAPLAAALGAGEDVFDARVVWLNTCRAHALTTRRLRVGSEWPLTLRDPSGALALQVRVLAVRVRTEIKEGPRVLHLCSVDLPAGGHPGLEALLRIINPSVAPPERTSTMPSEADQSEEPESNWSMELEDDSASESMAESMSESASAEVGRVPEPVAPTPPWEADPTPPAVEQARKIDSGALLEGSRQDKERARKREEARDERRQRRARRKERAASVPRRSRRRLPPQRRLSNHIPRNADQAAEADRPRPSFNTEPSAPKKGLRVAELVKPEFHHGDPPIVVATFASTELFRRSTRSGSGWLQLTLADREDIPDQQEMALELILPTGVQVHTLVQVARRGRGRMILEARDLSPAAADSIRVVS